MVNYHHHHFIRSQSSTVCQSSEQFTNTMNKTYQAHISAYENLYSPYNGSNKKFKKETNAYGSLIVIGLEASKYSETRYNKVISHKNKNI